MTPYSKARRSRMAQDQDEKERLVNCLKELHLPAFRSGYEELARQAQQEALSYEQYLLGLGQRECQERQGRRIERLLRDSRLPLEKSWPALDLKRLPAKVVQQARTLLEGTTAAAIDRLVHHSVIIEVNLPNYRVEQAKKRKQARPADEGESASGPGAAKA